MHLAAAVFYLKVAVEGKSSGLVCAKFEGDRMARTDPLGDPIGVNRHAVGDVFRAKLDLYQVVLRDFDPLRAVLVPAPRDRPWNGGGLLPRYATVPANPGT